MTFAASTAEQQPCYVLKIHICTIFVPTNAAVSVGTAVGRFLDVRMSFFKGIRKQRLPPDIFLFVILSSQQIITTDLPFYQHANVFLIINNQFIKLASSSVLNNVKRYSLFSVLVGNLAN